MPRRPWRVSVTRQAWADLEEILSWTAREFGPRQSRAYETTIATAIAALRNGPGVSGARARDDIQPGLRTLHVARKGRRGRHFLFFRVVSEELRTLAVTRILHDSMDFARHIANDE
jgi:toxin ParE1/3/4